MNRCIACGVVIPPQSTSCPVCRAVQRQTPAPTDLELQQQLLDQPEGRTVLLAPSAGLERWERFLATPERRRATRAVLAAALVVALVLVSVGAWRTFARGPWAMRLRALNQIVFVGGSRNPQVLGGRPGTQADSQLYLIQPDVSRLHRLTDPATGAYLWPAWSPDGAHLAAFQAPTTPGLAAKLVIMNADGSDLQVIPSVSFFPARSAFRSNLVSVTPTPVISWSPDGRQLLALDDQAGYILLNSDGTHLRTIDGLMPTWSPDSRYLAYYTPDQGTSVFVTDLPFYPLQLTGSPIVILDTQTLQSRELRNLPLVSLGALAWSPDGRYLAYSTWQLDEQHPLPTGGIMLVRPDGTDHHTLAQWTGGEVDQLVWSPDSRQIAAVVVKVQSFLNDSTFTFGPFETSLWVIASDSSNPRNLGASTADQPSWAPDGHQLVFSQNLETSGGQRLVVADTTAQPFSLHDLSRDFASAPEAAQLFYVFAPAWSPLAGI